MNLDKNTIRAIGLLAFVGIFAASGFLVVKPQIEEGFDLMGQTTDSVSATDMRELRLLKLKTQNENMDALKIEVNQMLELVPSKKDVTNIAGAVIQAMPAGVQLVKFSHGEVVDGGPAYSVPTSSLTQPTPPFELVVPGEKPAAKNSDSKEDETKAAPVKKDPNNISAFVTAPFILEVKASGLESLNDYLDRLQNQDRLISVAAVTSNENNGELTATIYGYAFAGSTPEIKTWENPPADETPAN